MSDITTLIEEVFAEVEVIECPQCFGFGNDTNPSSTTNQLFVRCPQCHGAGVTTNGAHINKSTDMTDHSAAPKLPAHLQNALREARLGVMLGYQHKEVAESLIERHGITIDEAKQVIEQATAGS